MTRRAWLERWQQLGSMKPDELYDRIRQQAAARWDLVRYRLGSEPDAELETDAARRGRFFFSPADVPLLCELLRRRCPEQVGSIIDRAGRICRHRFDLLGYRDVDFGSEIDWHSDPIHNKRALPKPWYRIRYLDFAEVGDVKITWELNRHQHLVTLAKAYRLTGDTRFTTELFSQWRHWQKENPYPIGINWASSLEVAFRSLSWLWVYFLLEGSPAMPTGFRTDWLRALAVSGRHLDHYRSTYFSPNTHLLGEAVALMFIGMLCPELASAARWMQDGWELVLKEAERQVRPDGMHFEQSTYYHVYALDFFLHAGVLASINDVPVPPEYDGTLQRMLEALCLLGRAGIPAQLGDDDGGRVFDPTRHHAHDLLDPLATGAILFGRGDFKFAAGGIREETVWLLGRDGLGEFDRVEAKAPNKESTRLESAGIYLLAGKEAGIHMVIDAGPQGALNAGHGHADALSVTAVSDQRELLIDRGTLEYAGKDSLRDAFRGTAAHNTLVVDEADQAEPRGPFGWGKLPEIKLERWVTGDNFDLFAASHNGYCRLTRPVVHRRWVFSLKSDFWLIRDQASGEGEHRLDLFWHIAPKLRPRREALNLFVDADGFGFYLLGAEDHGWSEDVRHAKYSPVYGRKERSHVVHFGTSAMLPAEFVTLLIPVRQSVQAYCYRDTEGLHYACFSDRKNPWTIGPWHSDAEFFYWGRNSDGTRQTLIACDVSNVELGGARILSSSEPVSRCELIVSQSDIEIAVSDPSATVNGEALRIHSTELQTADSPASSQGRG